jgi:type IV fimbrial biogenesis protein FimT
MLKLPLQRLRGFTLVEMMIGMAILAVLIAMAVPNFSLWVKNLGIRTVAESIQGGLMLARTEALKRNKRMRFQLTNSLAADCALYDSDEDSTWAWIVSENSVTGENSATGMCNVAPSVGEGDGRIEPFIEQTYDGNQAGGNNVRIFPDQNLFTFNWSGSLAAGSAEGSILITDAEGEEGCVAEGGKARCLRIDVTVAGIRMCDPALPSSNTQACN